MRFHLSTFVLASSIAAALANPDSGPRVSQTIDYTGICGASAAAAAGTNLFVVADDETSRLRVYSRDRGGPALQSVDLTPQLQLTGHDTEADIEGAARLGDKVFWITSHSRTHTGKMQPNRCRFFATSLSVTNSEVKITFVGQPYVNLLSDLAADPSLAPLNLAAAARLAPKRPGGLNIEGLCATPDNHLLIGFRNPIRNDQALLVPLQNPEEVISGLRPIFGKAIELDLNGLGIRDMGFWNGQYLIIAGSFDGGGRSRLFSWAGDGTRPKQLKDVDLKGFNAEALIIYPDKALHQVQLLSDDGTQSGPPCQNIRPDQRHFRSVWVSLDHKPGKKR
ncbi:MAG: DUF3616 domain-containing protein [Verrucomicrobiota bacterium]